jgi:hypothetical protein
MTHYLIDWIKRDFVVIIVCLMSLLGCLYTMLTVGTYQQRINEAWQLQWDASGCGAFPDRDPFP